MRLLRYRRRYAAIVMSPDVPEIRERGASREHAGEKVESADVFRYCESEKEEGERPFYFVLADERDTRERDDGKALPNPAYLRFLANKKSGKAGEKNANGRTRRAFRHEKSRKKGEIFQKLFKKRKIHIEYSEKLCNLLVNTRQGCRVQRQ